MPDVQVFDVVVDEISDCDDTEADGESAEGRDPEVRPGSFGH